MKNLMETQAYLDCNATTSVLPEAARAAFQTMSEFYGNPSSPHFNGWQARRLLEDVRLSAAGVIGVSPAEVIFTSGATEAIHMAVFSALLEIRNQQKLSPPGSPRKILYGSTEHKAVPGALYHWTEILGLSHDVVPIEVDRFGQLDLKALSKNLEETDLLCTMAVNNETGVIQDLSRIEELLDKSEKRCLWLVDCVQAIGKVKLNFSKNRVDYASFSGHKIHAPKGIGFLYVKTGSPLHPLIVGGGQEHGARSGTENLPGVAALGVVLNKMQNQEFLQTQVLDEYRQRLIRSLKEAFLGISFNAPSEMCVPTTINFSVPGMSSKELLDTFDAAGLRMSAGSACSSSSVKPSAVLTAMGLEKWKCLSAVRLSFGLCTSSAEIDRACEIIRKCSREFKKNCLMSEQGYLSERTSKTPDQLTCFHSEANNCWVFVESSSRSCVIIDPVREIGDRLVQWIRCQSIQVLAILDTHSHGDHESPLRQLAEKLMKPDARSQMDPLGWPKKPFIRFGSSDWILTFSETPGHTLDSRMYLLGKSRSEHLEPSQVEYAFPGDTILAGGLGRTNFPVSDVTAMYETITKIQKQLGEKTILCPGHDYQQSLATQLHLERAHNPLLQAVLDPFCPISLEEFCKAKTRLDQGLALLENSYQGVVCGITTLTQTSGGSQLSLPLENFKGGRMIDIREAHEYALIQDWQELGLRFAPENIPLSRFVSLLNNLLQRGDYYERILLLCRTGSRSLKAVECLRRFGFSNVWNLEGGISGLMDQATFGRTRFFTVTPPSGIPSLK